MPDTDTEHLACEMCTFETDGGPSSMGGHYSGCPIRPHYLQALAEAENRTPDELKRIYTSRQMYSEAIRRDLTVTIPAAQRDVARPSPVTTVAGTDPETDSDQSGPSLTDRLRTLTSARPATSLEYPSLPGGNRVGRSGYQRAIDDAVKAAESVDDLPDEIFRSDSTVKAIGSAVVGFALGISIGQDPQSAMGLATLLFSIAAGANGGKYLAAIPERRLAILRDYILYTSVGAFAGYRYIGYVEGGGSPLVPIEWASDLLDALTTVL
ncbi:hypothetical protein [Halomarina oriensis]|uniref:Uncharacterized protein n=1 Tax=Halomarina oriensis TaxID=671145 RepID=A0A6B0GXI7_9EURY|nr:hypothetical protein [Halomarina oriensis]MWG36488.1 hypothetical protein [Halomarina oriensis]